MFLFNFFDLFSYRTCEDTYPKAFESGGGPGAGGRGQKCKGQKEQIK